MSDCVRECPIIRTDLQIRTTFGFVNPYELLDTPLHNLWAAPYNLLQKKCNLGKLKFLLEKSVCRFHWAVYNTDYALCQRHSSHSPNLHSASHENSPIHQPWYLKLKYPYTYILFTIPYVSVWLFTLSPVKTAGARSFIFGMILFKITLVFTLSPVN